MFLNIFSKKVEFRAVKIFEEGKWWVPTRRCTATVLGDFEMWRSGLEEAMKALPEVHQSEQCCDMTVW